MAPTARATSRLNAPKLSGQGAWYLERQLRLFKQGARGTHEKDVFGKMMAPMAATLADDAAIANVVGLHREPAGHAGGGDDARAMPTRAASASRPAPPATAPTARHRGDQRAPAQGHERLVHGQAAEEFQRRCPRRHPQDIYGGQMALIAGCWPTTRRSATSGLHQHALTAGERHD
jgi:cytochrome c oxidase subunit 2